MPGFPTTRHTPNDQGLFSAEEIQHLMRVEFERAQRHGFPIVCLMVAVDRLEALQDLYGYESKAEILGAVVRLLKAATRDSDYLGYMVDDRLLAVFPHTPPGGASVLARRLLSGARGLVFDRDGRTLRITLSIGVSHNQHKQHKGRLSFDTLLRVAEEGLSVADAAGGDRFVETELYQLFEDRRAKERAAEDAPAEPPMQLLAETSRPLPDEPGESPDRALLERLRRLLELEGGDLPPPDELDREWLLRSLKALQPEEGGTKPADLREKQRQIELLERRVAKLTQALGLTEDELKRIASMKGIELGLSSIYRDVQGLSGDESHFATKKELMRSIFEANVLLKQQLPRGPS